MGGQSADAPDKVNEALAKCKAGDTASIDDVEGPVVGMDGLDTGLKKADIMDSFTFLRYTS